MRMHDLPDLLDLLGDSGRDSNAVVVADHKFINLATDRPCDTAGLDAVAVPANTVTLTLDYPFNKPLVKTLHSPTGFTLRQIIEAIRAGYREMYQATRDAQLPGLLNRHVTGPYGDAYHAMEDLVIERIRYDAQKGALYLSIGS